MATVVSTIFLASCAGDVYDPSKEPQAPPAENPFGEGFAAPDGFGWTMITPVKLNIEVKDDFNGQYKYLKYSPPIHCMIKMQRQLQQV